MKNKNIRTGLLSVISTLLLATQNLGAQIEEITVTAQKRAESAQDIGLTITAFDEDTLRADSQLSRDSSEKRRK